MLTGTAGITGNVFQASRSTEVASGNPVTVGVSVCKIIAVGLGVGEEPVMGTCNLETLTGGATVGSGKDSVGDTVVASAAQAVNKTHNTRFKNRFMGKV